MNSQNKIVEQSRVESVQERKHEWQSFRQHTISIKKISGVMPSKFGGPYHWVNAVVDGEPVRFTVTQNSVPTSLYCQLDYLASKTDKLKGDLHVVTWKGRGKYVDVIILEALSYLAEQHAKDSSLGGAQ